VPGNLFGVSDSGRPITADEIDQRWRPWSPADVQRRLGGVDVLWGVAAGWAIDLFIGEVTRAHDDIEITVPAAGFPAIVRALDDHEWDVVGDGRLWSYPDAVDRYRQTWARDPASGSFVLDVIREPHDNDMWVYRRDPTIRMPLAEAYDRNDAGIPFVVPEIVLLFKSAGTRAKDERDFDRVVPRLTPARRARLGGWLHQMTPQHPWIARLEA
jgi:hypothetical protein